MLFGIELSGLHDFIAISLSGKTRFASYIASLTAYGRSQASSDITHRVVLIKITCKTAHVTLPRAFGT